MIPNAIVHRLARCSAPASIALLALLAGPSHARQPSQSSQPGEAEPITYVEPNVPASDETAARIAGLIDMLGSPRYQEREEATAELLAIGAPDPHLLREVYHQSDDLEVRLRVEQVVHEAYIDRTVFARTGYLGIQVKRGLFPTHYDDPRIPEGHSGIALQEVKPDTAAQRAGLQPNDVIMALDSEPLGGRGINAFNAFAADIRKRGVGGRATLTVLRGEGRLDVDVRLGRPPKDMVKQINGLNDLVSRANRDFWSWWADNFRDPIPTESDINPTPGSAP